MLCVINKAETEGLSDCSAEGIAVKESRLNAGLRVQANPQSPDDGDGISICASQSAAPWAVIHPQKALPGS